MTMCEKPPYENIQIGQLFPFISLGRNITTEEKKHTTTTYLTKVKLFCFTLDLCSLKWQDI